MYWRSRATRLRNSIRNVEHEMTQIPERKAMAMQAILDIDRARKPITTITDMCRTDGENVTTQMTYRRHYNRDHQTNRGKVQKTNRTSRTAINMVNLG